MDLLKQKAEQRYDALPEHVRSFLMSEETADTVWTTGESYHLSNEKIGVVAQIVGNIVLGVIPHERFEKEIQSTIGLDARIAKELTDELNSKVLSLVMPEVENLHKQPVELMPETPTDAPSFAPQPIAPKEDLPQQQVFFTQPPSSPETIPQEAIFEQTQQAPIQTTPPEPAPPQEQPTPPPQPTQKEDIANLLSPGFKERPNTPTQQNASAAPFVLHEEAQTQPLASGEAAPLSRPQFFKSTAEEKPQETPSTARLEIGADATPEAQQTGKTKREVPKVVNYTSPAVEVNPFERPEKKKEKPSPPQNETPKEVSPENVVDLKDLPR